MERRDLDFSLQNPLEDKAVALRCIFGAMTEESNITLFAEFLEQAQGKLLPVVLDQVISLVDAAAFLQLLAVAAAEFRPGDFAGLIIGTQALTRTEICHPDIILR